MFVPDFEKSIPGYTGHRPTKREDGQNIQKAQPTKHIPGKFELESDIYRLRRIC